MDGPHLTKGIHSDYLKSITYRASYRQAEASEKRGPLLAEISWKQGLDNLYFGFIFPKLTFSNIQSEITASCESNILRCSFCTPIRKIGVKNPFRQKNVIRFILREAMRENL